MLAFVLDSMPGSLYAICKAHHRLVVFGNSVRGAMHANLLSFFLILYLTRRTNVAHERYCITFLFN